MNYSYFSQPEILDRIPKLFYLLGGLYLGLEIIALFLIRIPSAEEQSELVEISKEKADEVNKQYMQFM